MLLGTRLLNTIQSVLLPATCVVCGDLTRREIAVCRACELELPRLTHGCEQCALPLPAAGQSSVCGQCLNKPPPFNRTFALYHYLSPIKQLLYSLKFNGKLSYSQLLGQLMLTNLQQYYGNDALPESIIPVPLHPTRIRQRGFNQAFEIAKPIAKSLQIPILYKQCFRTRATLAQTHTSAKLRYKNVKNAFQVKPFEAIHVAVFDDVMTTGHTAAELCRALRKVGVRRIDFWCCARTS